MPLSEFKRNRFLCSPAAIFGHSNAFPPPNTSGLAWARKRELGRGSPIRCSARLPRSWHSVSSAHAGWRWQRPAAVALALGESVELQHDDGDHATLFRSNNGVDARRSGNQPRPTQPAPEKTRRQPPGTLFSSWRAFCENGNHYVGSERALSRAYSARAPSLRSIKEVPSPTVTKTHDGADSATGSGGDACERRRGRIKTRAVWLELSADWVEVTTDRTLVVIGVILFSSAIGFAKSIDATCSSCLLPHTLQCGFAVCYVPHQLLCQVP
jgi:hypothetical protein